jgi:hypothetical protein
MTDAAKIKTEDNQSLGTEQCTQFTATTKFTVLII